MREMIYHLAQENIWKESQESGFYSPSSLSSEGFIHCSKKDQLLRVANQFFKDQPSIMLIGINLSKLTSPVKWEPGTDKPEEMFPHVFGIINLEAVEKVITIERDKNGKFSLPEEITS